MMRGFGYEEFAAAYIAIFGICCGIGFLVVLAAAPLVGLSIVAAFLVIGGIYIAHREGWLRGTYDSGMDD